MAIETLASLAMDRGVDLSAGPSVMKSDESSLVANPRPWLIEALGGGPSASGVSVTPDSALQQTTVYACLTVISESVAGLPLHLYLRDGEDKRRDRDNRLYRLLHDQPNPWQTSFEWRELMTLDVLRLGNAYSFIELDGRMNVTGLLPLNPYRMRVEIDGAAGGLLHWYRFPDGEERRIPSGQIFHLRGKSLNGYTGLSPISAHRESIGLAIAAERYGAHLFSNGAAMGGYFKLPPSMSPEATKSLQAYIERRHAGFGKAHKPGFLDAGVEWVQTTIPPEDAQFLELRKYQREDICAIYRVPPHMVGDLSCSTNNNIEHQSLEFVTHTCRPWLVRWEQALNRDLLGPYEQPKRFFEFDVNGLLRGDVKARSEAYAKGRQWGWLSVNDIRRWENLNGIGPDGDRYLEPLNMIEAGDEKPKQEGGV